MSGLPPALREELSTCVRKWWYSSTPAVVGEQCHSLRQRRGRLGGLQQVVEAGVEGQDQVGAAVAERHRPQVAERQRDGVADLAAWLSQERGLAFGEEQRLAVSV